jgi:hypothetical protein
MEKILLLVDGKGLDRSAFDFACYLAELTRSTLTAIYIDPKPSGRSQDLRKIYAEIYMEYSSVVDDLPEEHWKSKLAENKKAFVQACTNKSIRWDQQATPVTDVDQIVSETRFADVLITSATLTSDENPESPPTPFVKEILSHSECPVIIAPVDFTGVDEVLFAYDGSASAVYAIKQFTYLFPRFSETRTVFLQIHEDEKSTITDHEKIGDYLKMHYAALGFHILHGKAADELFTYLLGKKNIFVVAGAYGRTAFSSLLRKSTAELLLKTTTLPVFIAHR